MNIKPLKNLSLVFVTLFTTFVANLASAQDIPWASSAEEVGMSSERLWIYRARGLQQIGPGGGDDSEDIRVHRVPLEQLASWLRQQSERGCLIDARGYAGPAWAALDLADAPGW